MIAVISLLLVLTISMILIRVSTVALVHTGTGREAARFQARSAFTGAGFTTSEAENVVSHPVRRRIVSWLMLAGNVGIVTAMSSLLLSFVDMLGSQGAWLSLGVPAAGLALLLVVSSSTWVDRYLSRAISWALRKFTQLDVRDYARLLHLREDYGISDLRVRPAGVRWLRRGLAARLRGFGSGPPGPNRSPRRRSPAGRGVRRTAARGPLRERRAQGTFLCIQCSGSTRIGVS